MATLTACSASDASNEAPDDATGPEGTLTIGENTFPTALDADVGFAGYTLMAYGIAESLMRVTPDNELVPWVAESVEQVDPLTLEVTIRDDVTFWDGEKVDATAVQRSLERSVTEQPGTDTLIPAGTTFAADGQVLTITTPEPVGSLSNNLASFNFTIKKVADDGSLVYTGPYRYAEFVEQTSIVLEAYEGHRTPAAVATIEVQMIPDVSARLLALQAGDIDMAYAMLPSLKPQLEAAGMQIHEYPFGRQNDLVFNVNRPPFDDVAVRQAISLAIDREALVDGVLAGSGTPAYALAPEDIGLTGLVATQEFDLAEAGEVLDAAGWVEGADGIRTKDGDRLAFALGYYTSRAELEPLATIIRDQLTEIGIEVKLESIADINTAMAENEFDATLYSYNVAPFGEIDRAIGQLYTPSSTNNERYSNDEVNALFEQYRTSLDEAEREDLLRQIQELIGADVPVVYLVNPNQIVATAPDVTDFTPHFLENYKIDPALGIG
ncbi:ABC transporter substrate-binding protein [Jiangella asiatica]|uniref:Solute-binding protein family 5 domain-containing protein n=1 Tax=Jiangella asiatica TaxID=2530372 RepID=A0A4R5DJK2_9ACTN|nr:ABC transporter substrate-binding protein [Jiangella asiatica]TDE12170.1 hypothetical protein E1269_07710 [Jiangella asiatica]